MNFATLHPPLIADPDPSFLRKLAEDTGATLAPPITVATEKALEDQLDHGRHVFSGIFVNLDLAGEETVGVLSKIRRTRPSTPIYLISGESSAAAPLTSQQLESLTVQERIAKPFNYMQILKRVTSAQTPESQQIQYLDESSEGARIEVANADKEFIQVFTSQFLPGAPSHFDIYIRLTETRFIKILREGDALGHDRLEFYRKKSIEHFYIRQSTYEDFLRNCRATLLDTLETPDFSAGEKIRVTLQHGNQVMAFLQSRKIPPSAFQHAQEFVDSVLKLLDVLKLKDIAEIRAQLKDPVFQDHASASTLIGAMIGSRLGLRGEKMLSLLGISSFLHDIAIPLDNPKFLENDERSMNEAELKVFHEHPTQGAAMLKKLGRFEPIAIQAVAQHHERRNRKGFPEHLGAGQISLISEVVGISDELLVRISRCSSATHPADRDPVREMEMDSFNGFSAPVIDAFRQCFGR